MSALVEERRITDAPADYGQPCALDCAHARALRRDPFGEEWLWCTHPANSRRVVHPGNTCSRFAPAGLIGPRLLDSSF